MADYRYDDDPTLPGAAAGMNRSPETDPEHLLADHTASPAVPGTIGGGASADPDTVRDEIERTRARMSSTIDQIEGALQRKKGQIQERLDVVAPIRERPWIFAAGVFGTGLALGLLTGGGDDDDRDHVKVPRALLAGMNLNEDTAGNGFSGGGGNGFTGTREWEERSRELMQIVAHQEEEIRDLRAVLYDYAPEGYTDLGAGDERMGADALGDVDVTDEWDEDWNDDDGGDALDDFGAFGVEGESGGFLRKAVAAAVAAGLAGVIGGVGKKIVASRGRRDEMDVEVDLERSRGYAGAEMEADGSRQYTGRFAVPHLEATDGYELQYGSEVPASRAAPYAGDVEYREYGQYGYDAGYDRELEVEVELERPRTRAVSWEGPGGRGLPVSPLAGAVAAGAAALVGGLVAKLVNNRSHREEMDVEVELEQRGHMSSPQPITAERVYEVELEERPGDAPSDPPLM